MLNDIGHPDEIKRIGSYLVARFSNGTSETIHTKICLQSFSSDSCSCNESLFAYEQAYICKHTIYLRAHRKPVSSKHRLNQIFSRGTKQELIYAIVTLATSGNSEQRLVHFLDKSAKNVPTMLYSR